MTVRPLTVLFLASMPLLLGGCAIPVAFSIASYAADGVLLLTTDKAGSDHLLSLSAGQDCAMWRVVKGREICTDYKPGEDDPYSVDRNAPHREVGEGGMVAVYAPVRQGGRILNETEARDALHGQPAPSSVQAAAVTAAAPAVETIPKPPAERKSVSRSTKPSGKVRIAAKGKPAALARRPASSPPPASSAVAPTPAPERVTAIDPPAILVTAAPPEAWR